MSKERSQRFKGSKRNVTSNLLEEKEFEPEAPDFGLTPEERWQDVVSGMNTDPNFNLTLQERFIDAQSDASMQSFLKLLEE